MLRELRKLPWIVIAARTSSGVLGVLQLLVAARYLAPNQFAELAFFQAFAFIIQISIDGGLTQLAVEETSGVKGWRQSVKKYQGMRHTLHLVASLLISILYTLFNWDVENIWLPYCCALALLSNSINGDWILVCLQKQKQWAIKTLFCGFFNLTVTFALLKLVGSPSAVFLGILAGNITGWLYLKRLDIAVLQKFNLPKKNDMVRAGQLTIGGVNTHFAYNMPMVTIGYALEPIAVATFACMYRVFSAATMFVPPVTEFLVAKEIALQKATDFREKKGRIWFRLLVSALLLVSPFLVIPSNMLLMIGGFVIDFEKFGVTANHLIVIKLILLFYCMDFCAQRTAYILKQRFILVVASSCSLFATICCLGYLTFFVEYKLPYQWFFSIMIFQILNSFLVLVFRQKSLGYKGLH